MSFNILFELFALLVISYPAAHAQVDHDSTFRIKSQQYGYVHHYGIYLNLDLLNFTYNYPPADFRFTAKRYLQETSTSKCVARKTDGDQQLVLCNCNGTYVDKWIYDSASELLQAITAPGQGCFSPWNYRWRPPQDLNVTTGVSPCDTWNQIILEPDSKQQAKNIHIN